ncbi:Sjogren's syndrome/scleroderma autoantigen 1 family protein [Halomarina ordinaria]|uniref:Sjogren's syndrome/scleroderma autoantigen 1 family protein n=1 Tax=Halomarina ordinaria TaxID=3033939 RepID=A0ABD5U971_9EURY|nr:Sjogren's syndrome/scleroderma autoantigen 1 family protein [Halomarina sp. PSRA2]
MSDFDKEAEREKLREQFAEDERRRAGTQRMSELLLKGATMTNKHCDTCGDPVFRWQGEAFCPTCSSAQEAQQRATAEQGAEATAPDEGPTPDEATANEVPVETPDPSDDATGTPDAPRPRTERVDGAAAPARPSAEPASDAPDRPAGQYADLAAARESLARTVTRFAREAEDADDLARAREFLGAVGDAADALAAVRRAER